MAALHVRAREREVSRAGVDKGPVFIVGMNGSGTTMLLDCLNSHPNLYGFPLETRVLPYYLERAHTYGDLTDDKRFLKLWQDLRSIVFFKIVNGGEPPPLPDDWAEHERSLASVLDAIFRYFAAREGKRRWCEKSPLYALHLERFASAYPSARFIHLIRDGRDCAASFNRRWGFTPAKTMHHWKHVVRRGRELGSTLGNRYMEVRYEELTDWPRTTMRQLCAFLDEPYISDVLEIGRPRNQKKTLAVKIIPNSEKWRTCFSPRELRRLERIGGALLHELGYETSDPVGDWDVSRYLMGYWACRDNSRRAGEAIFRIMKTSDGRRRRLMIQRLATSVWNKLQSRVA